MNDWRSPIQKPERRDIQKNQKKSGAATKEKKRGGEKKVSWGGKISKWIKDPVTRRPGQTTALPGGEEERSRWNLYLALQI